MTLKMKLRKLRRTALNKLPRTKEEKKMINDFITERLVEAAYVGKKSVKFGINHISETINNPKNDSIITIKASDYIKFAIKHLMRFKIVTNDSFLALNYVQIFY